MTLPRTSATLDHTKMQVIYIASPYTVGDVAANVAVQKAAAHTIIDAGHCPIAPLLAHYLHIHRQRHYDDWLQCDFALLLRSDIVLRLPGTSAGADKEVALARAHNIPVAIGWAALGKILQPIGNDKKWGEA